MKHVAPDARAAGAVHAGLRHVPGKLAALARTPAAERSPWTGTFKGPNVDGLNVMVISSGFITAIFGFSEKRNVVQKKP